MSDIVKQNLNCIPCCLYLSLLLDMLEKKYRVREKKEEEKDHKTMFDGLTFSKQLLVCNQGQCLAYLCLANISENLIRTHDALD